MAAARGKLTQPDGRIVRTVKTRHPRGFMAGDYLDRQYEVADEEKPFEFFMNRFRLLEPAPRSDFSRYTGTDEALIRPQIDTALAKAI